MPAGVAIGTCAGRAAVAGMKAATAWLVLLGLTVCFAGGQIERASRAHHVNSAAVGNTLGITLDTMAVLVVAGLVMLVSYLRTGHPLPGHARPAPLPPPPRPRPGPLEYSAEIAKLGDGVMAGPSIALVEVDEPELGTLPGAGELGAAHLELSGKGGGDAA